MILLAGVMALYCYAKPQKAWLEAKVTSLQGQWCRSYFRKRKQLQMSGSGLVTKGRMNSKQQRSARMQYFIITGEIP